MSDDEKLKGIAPIELGEKTVQQVQLVMATRDIKNHEFVNAHWELVHCCDGSYRSYPRGTILVQDVNSHWFNFDSWSAAAEFTRERLEQLRQVEEELQLIGILKCDIESGSWDEGYLKVVERVLAREESALAELKKGMR